MLDADNIMRLYIPDQLDEAIKLLDEAEIRNDLDSGGRIMVSEVNYEDATLVLEDAGIDWNLV